MGRTISGVNSNGSNSDAEREHPKSAARKICKEQRSDDAPKGRWTTRTRHGRRRVTHNHICPNKVLADRQARVVPNPRRSDINSAISHCSSVIRRGWHTYKTCDVLQGSELPRAWHTMCIVQPVNTVHPSADTSHHIRLKLLR